MAHRAVIAVPAEMGYDVYRVPWSGSGKRLAKQLQAGGSPPEARQIGHNRQREDLIETLDWLHDERLYIVTNETVETALVVPLRIASDIPGDPTAAGPGALVYPATTPARLELRVSGARATCLALRETCGLAEACARQGLVAVLRSWGERVKVYTEESSDR